MLKFVCCIVLALAASKGSAQDDLKGGIAYKAGDYALALREWTSMAQQGSVRALFGLGFMYSQGDGVPQDYAEAAKWYRLAAEQGDMGAQFILGNMYRDGRGVPQDYVAAHMWYNISSANGGVRAREGRAAMAAIMIPADVSEAQRRARVCMVSDYRDCD
jgi:uncharacterized protein